MSNESAIAPAILDIVEFLASLADLKRACSRAQSLRTADGKVHQVEHVFNDGVGRQAGLQKTDKGYRIVTDCHGLTPEQVKKQEESVGQIVQRYAHRKVIQELQAQGYTVTEEERRPDNTVRLLARKWS